MIEYVEPNADMREFFAHPRITHRKTRNWTRPDGQRHWFAIDHRLTLAETRDLLDRLPIGAYVVSFDWQYDSPSDPGAYVALQKYPETWTAEFSNHGWSSYKVPLDFESATRLYWDGLLIDDLHFMGYQSNREPKLPAEYRAHSGLSRELPKDFEQRVKREIVEYIDRRVAEIDGSSQSPPSPRLE